MPTNQDAQSPRSTVEETPWIPTTRTNPSQAASPPHRMTRRSDRLGTLYRFSIDQYEKMLKVGILESGDPIELLDGLLVLKMTKGESHITAVHLVMEALRLALPPGWHARMEAPINLPGGQGGSQSVPEPDLTIVRGGVRDYKARHPVAADAALVVEVAATSLAKDRRGLARYARDGVPIAWILNLPTRSLEVYNAPSGPGPDPRYAESRTFNADDSAPLVLDGREVATIRIADLLP